MKVNKIQKFLVMMIVALVSFILIFGVFTSSAVKKYGFDFIQLGKYYFIQSPFDTVKKMAADFNEMNNIATKEKQIVEDAKQMQFYKNENIVLQSQIDELTNLLKMKNTNKQFDYQFANIITRNTTTFSDEFVIDIGENKGVQEGQIVVGSAGIVGKVKAVSKLTSTITLITSSKSIQQIAANVFIDEKTVLYGIIQGFNKKENVLELRVLDDQKVAENAAVTTSGLGKLYPAGITIGKVKKSNQLENELGQNVFVEIAQDLDNIKFVGVIVGSK